MECIESKQIWNVIKISTQICDRIIFLEYVHIFYHDSAQIYIAPCFQQNTSLTQKQNNIL